MEQPPLGWRHGRGQELRDALKVMACGLMIGSGILFPLASIQGLWFRAITLSIFILSTVCFHVLHSKPFRRFGSFTCAVALIILLGAVLSAGSSRNELIPWLPVFIASLSLIMAAAHELALRIRPHPPSFAAMDEFSGVSIDSWSARSAIDTWSERSAGTPPALREPPPLHESNRLNSLYFDLHGPPSRASHRTGTHTTEISLASVAAQCRPHWDAQTQSFFRVPDGSLPEDDDVPDAMEEPHAGNTSRGDDHEPDVESDQESAEPSHPLLGPH